MRASLIGIALATGSYCVAFAVVKDGTNLVLAGLAGVCFGLVGLASTRRQ